MKISFVSRWGVQCGIATYTDQLVSAIKEKHDIQCECLAEKFAGIEKIKVITEDVEVVRCWDGRQANYDALFKRLMSNKPSIVHFQHEFGLMGNMNPLINLVTNIRALKIPIVFTPHTVMPKPNPQGWFFTEILSKADRVVAHNEQAKRELLKWGLKENQIRVISHGTPEGRGADEKIFARKSLYLPESKDVVIALSLGFITQGKMQHEAIDAIVYLAKEGLIDTSKFLYVIAGAPGQNTKENIEYCRLLHEKVDKERAWNYIRIVPRFIEDDELSLWYGAADFAITGSHPTFYSVSGRSHQELAYGIPSVSAEAHLLSDLNKDRSLKYDSSLKLRSHILTMIREPRLRKALKKRCSWFAKETSWTNSAVRHVSMYEELV